MIACATIPFPPVTHQRHEFCSPCWRISRISTILRAIQVAEALRTSLTVMAGRIANEEQDAIFRPYSHASDAHNPESTKVAGKDVTKLKPPIVKDTAKSGGSTPATSKKKKKPKKKSSVGYQSLQSWRLADVGAVQTKCIIS